MVHKKLFRVSCVLYYPSAKQRWIVQGILDSLNQSGTKTRDLDIFFHSDNPLFSWDCVLLISFLTRSTI